MIRAGRQLLRQQLLGQQRMNLAKRLDAPQRVALADEALRSELLAELAVRGALLAIHPSLLCEGILLSEGILLLLSEGILLGEWILLLLSEGILLGERILLLLSKRTLLSEWALLPERTLLPVRALLAVGVHLCERILRDLAQLRVGLLAELSAVSQVLLRTVRIEPRILQRRQPQRVLKSRWILESRNVLVRILPIASQIRPESLRDQTALLRQ